MKTQRTAILALTAALAIASCGGDGDESVDTAPATSPPTTEAEPVETDAATTTVAELVEETTTTTPPTTTVPDVPRQPLTGQPLSSVADITPRPALAVKIDNHPRARQNHSGLAVADIVFEELVEGSLTRFAAVFHTNDADPVGPIRSGRSQDVNLLSSFTEPLFAWSGGNPGVTALIRASFLTDLNAQRNSGSYYRGPGSAPHNLYSSTETLYASTPEDHPGAPIQQFEYQLDGETFAGDPATDVDLSIGQIEMNWNFDEEAGRYLRSQEGSEHVDKTYGRIGAENVVVMIVDYRPSQIDNRSPEAQTVGEGQVFVFSNGQLIEGTWAKEDAVFLITLTDADGEPIRLTPGTTWIELAQSADNLRYS